MSILFPGGILAGRVIPDFKSKAWDVLCTRSRCRRECHLGRSQASVCQSPSPKHVVWAYQQIHIQGAEEIKPPAFSAVLRWAVSKSLRLSETLWAIACQPPLSMGLFRQEFWRGLPFPSLGDLPDPGIKHTSLVSCVAEDSLPAEPSEKPQLQDLLQTCKPTWVKAVKLAWQPSSCSSKMPRSVSSWKKSSKTILDCMSVKTTGWQLWKLNGKLNNPNEAYFKFNNWLTKFLHV